MLMVMLALIIPMPMMTMAMIMMTIMKMLILMAMIKAIEIMKEALHIKYMMMATMRIIRFSMIQLC